MESVQPILVKEKLLFHQIPGKWLFQFLIVEIVDLPTTSQGNVLFLQDYLIKWLMEYVISNQISHRTVKILVKEIDMFFRVPEPLLWPYRSTPYDSTREKTSLFFSGVVPQLRHQYRHSHLLPLNPQIWRVGTIPQTFLSLWTSTLPVIKLLWSLLKKAKQWYHSNKSTVKFFHAGE